MGTHYEARISSLPYHCGNGYGWGGDIILTINHDSTENGFSINLGSSANGDKLPMKIAQIITAALNAFNSTIDNPR